MSERRLLWPAIATAIGCAILVSLGVWQLQRMQWKQTLIARVSERMGERPTPLPPSPQWTQPGFIDGWEYRPVIVQGNFRQVERGARDLSHVYSLANLSEPNGPLGGLGYWVLDAFYPDGGGTVYVNRGFVPLELLGDEAPPPRGQTAITGIVLPSQPGNFATPECETDEPICYTRDVARFAAGSTNPVPIAPFFIDLEAGSSGLDGIPQAGETRVRFPNNHLQYALTWFGLALGLAAVFIAFARSRMSR